MAFLGVNDQNGYRKVLLPQNKPLTIGRSRGNQFSIPQDSKVSKHHALIRYVDGKYWIEDLNSRHGTSVDGTRVQSKILVSGMELGFGPDFKCKFYSSPQAKPEVDESVDSETIVEISADMADYDDSEDSSGDSVMEEAHLEKLGPLEEVVEDIPLADSVVSIGRSPENTIRLDNKTVSRKHCVITRMDAVYFIQDLNSSNGIFVNDVQVQEQKLQHGDRIRVGSFQFNFKTTPAETGDAGDRLQRKRLTEIDAEPPPEAVHSDRKALYWTLVLALLGIFIVLLLLMK